MLSDRLAAPPVNLNSETSISSVPSGDALQRPKAKVKRRKRKREEDDDESKSKS